MQVGLHALRVRGLVQAHVCHRELPQLVSVLIGAERRLRERSILAPAVGDHRAQLERVALQPSGTVLWLLAANNAGRTVFTGLHPCLQGSAYG